MRPQYLLDRLVEEGRGVISASGSCSARYVTNTLGSGAALPTVVNTGPSKSSLVEILESTLILVGSFGLLIVNE